VGIGDPDLATGVGEAGVASCCRVARPTPRTRLQATTPRGMR